MVCLNQSLDPGPRECLLRPAGPSSSTRACQCDRGVIPVFSTSPVEAGCPKLCPRCSSGLTARKASISPCPTPANWNQNRSEHREGWEIDTRCFNFLMH